MPVKLKILLAIAAFTASSIAHAQFHDGLGLVLWSGQQTNAPAGSKLNHSADTIAGHGVKTLRFVLAPQSTPLYGLENVECPIDSGEYLACVTRHPQVFNVLSHADLKTVGLVVYDPVAAGPTGHGTGFMNEDFVNQQADQIRNEYASLAYGLIVLHSGSNKRFVISAWEADNQVYCGSAYHYLLNTAGYPVNSMGFRDWCLATYPTRMSGSKNPSEGMAGLKRWFEIRQEGLEQGRQQAWALGAGGVQVDGAMEISAVHMLESIGAETTLDQIASKVNFELVTYSAYESLAYDTLEVDLAEIKRRTQKPIAVSEYGFSPSEMGLDAAAASLEIATRILTRLLHSGEIEFATVWQAFEDGSPSEFGLLTHEGHRTEMFNAFERGATR